MKPIARTGVVASALLLVALFGAACGGKSPTTDSTTTSLLQLNGADRQTQLETAARTEGTVVWATTLGGAIVDDLVDAFQAKYPYLKVQANQLDEATLVSQTLQAAGAGKFGSDVLEVADNKTLVFKDAGALVPYLSAEASRVDPSYQITDDGGNVLALSDRISYIGFAYNSSLIPDSQAPKTLEDLLDPSLKGRMAMVTSFTSSSFIGGILAQLGDDAGKAFLQKLAAQDITQSPLSAANLAGLVASGQYAASPTIYLNHANQQAAKGAPVTWVPIQPVTANVGQLEVMTGVEHPAASMLFIDFLLSSEGQDIFKQNQYVSPADPKQFDSWDPIDGMKTGDEFSQAASAWGDLYKQYFGGASS